MNQTITYTNPHSSFKLEGVFYDKTGLSYLAERLISEGESYQVSLGHFILQWIDLSPEINLQTSGSTGTPKTILMSKQAMVNSAIATGNHFKLKPGDSALSCLPFEYIAAKMMFVRAYVLGLEMDCVNPSSNPLKALKRSYDFCAMVPLQLENSIEYLHHIKTIIVGGAKKHFLKNNAQWQARKSRNYGLFEFWASKIMKYRFSYTKMKQTNPSKM